MRWREGVSRLRGRHNGWPQDRPHQLTTDPQINEVHRHQRVVSAPRPRSQIRLAWSPLVDHTHNPVVDDNVIIWLDRQALPGLGQYELTCVSTERHC